MKTKKLKFKPTVDEKEYSYAAADQDAVETGDELITVKIANGDSFIQLPNRMIVVDGDLIVVTRDEYQLLKQMHVCD